MKAVAAMALAGVLAAGSAVSTSAEAFTAHGASTMSVSTAADWLAPAVTLTTPFRRRLLEDHVDHARRRGGQRGGRLGDGHARRLLRLGGDRFAGPDAPGPRSAATWSTSVTTLGEGTHTARATQTDSAGNTGTTAPSTFTIDTTAATRVSIAAANGTGTAGHLDAGDTIAFAYSEPMLASSILSGWTGTSGTPVVARFFSGSNDAFMVLDGASAANVKLDAGTTAGGGVSLASPSYVTNTVNFTATLTQSADKRSFVVTLGSPDNASRVGATPVTAPNMTWTPKAGPTDLATNALAGTAAYAETDSDVDF